MNRKISFQLFQLFQLLMLDKLNVGRCASTTRFFGVCRANRAIMLLSAHTNKRNTFYFTCGTGM